MYIYIYMYVYIYICIYSWRQVPKESLFQTPDPPERYLFIDNLLLRIRILIEMIRWTGLAPWEFEFPFPRTSTPRSPSSRCVPPHFPVSLQYRGTYIYLAHKNPHPPP